VVSFVYRTETKKQNKFKTKRKQKADNAHFDSVGDRHITLCTCSLGAAVVLGDCTRILHDLTSSLGSMTVHRSEGSLVRKLGTVRKYFMTGTPFVLFQKQWRLQKAGNLWQRNFLIFSKHLRACLACLAWCTIPTIYKVCRSIKRQSLERESYVHHVAGTSIAVSKHSEDSAAAAGRPAGGAVC